jgi:hypothetical protein
VDHLAGRHRAFDGIEELDEFMMPVARHATANDLASSMSRAANSVVVPLRL